MPITLMLTAQLPVDRWKRAALNVVHTRPTTRPLIVTNRADRVSLEAGYPRVVGTPVFNLSVTGRRVHQDPDWQDEFRPE
jgi:hypothetical protein